MTFGHHRGRGPWPPRWQGAFFAYYVRAGLHRRNFFLIGAAMLLNGLLVGVMGHLVGVDVHHRARGYALLAVFVLMLWGFAARSRDASPDRSSSSPASPRRLAGGTSPPATRSADAARGARPS